MFKGRHFDQSVILLCARWYLAYNLRRCHVNLFCSCLRFGVGVNFDDADTRYQFQA